MLNKYLPCVRKVIVYTGLLSSVTTLFQFILTLKKEGMCALSYAKDSSPKHVPCIYPLEYTQLLFPFAWITWSHQQSLLYNNISSYTGKHELKHDGSERGVGGLFVPEMQQDVY